MKIIDLKLSGLSCEACISRTTRALAVVKGVKAARVQKEAAQVDYEGDQPAELLRAVETAGYSAQVAS